MKDFDDMLPEEQAEQYHELATLLQQTSQQFLARNASAHNQAIQRVGERLKVMEARADFSEEILSGPVEREREIIQKPAIIGGRRGRTTKMVRVINVLAAVLIVGLLIGASIELFGSRSRPASPGAGVGAGMTPTPVTVHAEANGVEMSMSITLGPYFLSELVLAKISLTNHTNSTLMVRGRYIDPCAGALYLDQTGGEEPHYVLPLYGNVAFFCPMIGDNPIKPGQTITLQRYVILMSSGTVTLTGKARFLKKEANGYLSESSGPMDGHWPSLHIQVASNIPTDRHISLHRKGLQVIVDAPQNVQLVYKFIETCGDPGPGPAVGNLDWEPLAKRIINSPGYLIGCSAKDMQWQYAVGAVGYAIAAGTYPG